MKCWLLQNTHSFYERFWNQWWSGTTINNNFVSMMLIKCKEKGDVSYWTCWAVAKETCWSEGVKTWGLTSIVGTADMLTDLISSSQTSSPQISESLLTSTRKALAISSLSNLDMNQQEEMSWPRYAQSAALQRMQDLYFLTKGLADLLVVKGFLR